MYDFVFTIIIHNLTKKKNHYQKKKTIYDRPFSSTKAYSISHHRDAKQLIALAPTPKKKTSVVALIHILSLTRTHTHEFTHYNVPCGEIENLAMLTGTHAAL